MPVDLLSVFSATKTNLSPPRLITSMAAAWFATFLAPVRPQAGAASVATLNDVAVSGCISVETQPARNVAA